MDPDQRRETDAPREDNPRRNEADADESFWEWVALVVLLACWLAEASL